MQNQSRNIFILLALIIVVASSYWAITSFLINDNEIDKNQSELPKLTVGIQVSPAMALVMVAEDEGFFDAEGVDVIIKEFTAGKFALQAFLGGSLDVAISGEVPVTLSTLQGHKFRVIGQVVERTINEVRVVVRKEPGLNTPEKYFKSKTRTLATSFGGGPEFFTHNFLKKHDIADKDVKLISQRPQDMPVALASGTVDAIAIFDPFAAIAEKRMGAEGQSFRDGDIYSELYVIDVQQDTIDTKPKVLKALLRGMVRAQSFIKSSPALSKDIVIKYTKLEKDIVDAIWDNFIFKVSINEYFTKYTAAEAKWYIEKGTFSSNTPIPDFRKVLFVDFLKEIAPDQVVLDR
jgi:ABC-type nitrate/sulfonate/bicarbonate transport system substrate-binding protein